jgi:hypothetical protein
MPDKPPLLIGFISEPGMFDDIETWEQFLAEVQSMPDFLLKDSVVENANWVIAQSKQMLRVDGIEKLARALSSGAETISDHAREIAEAELDLLRIRIFRAGLFEALYLAETALPDGLLDLTKNLVKLERYERRASSRRKSALRAMSQNGGTAMVDAILA